MTKPIGAILVTLATIAPSAALAQQQQQQPVGPSQQAGNPPQQPAQAPRLELPQGAKLVATAEVDQVRAFPEQQSGKGKVPQEEIAGVRAVDRVYQTDRSYADVVKFFDQQAGQSGNKQAARDKTQTSTAWTIVLPQGRTVNVIARNTQPTSIEIISASDVFAEIQQGGAP